MTKRRIPAMILLAAMMSAAPVLSGYGQTLNLLSRTEARGQSVLLKEIVSEAENLPAGWGERPVAEAPDPGKVKNYSLQTIAYALQKYPDMNSVNLRGRRNVAIARATHAMDTEAVHKAIRSYIRSHERWQDKDIQIVYESGKQVLLPLGKQTARVEGFEEFWKEPGHLNFRVAIDVDGEHVRTARIPVRVLTITEVWFASKTIRRGQIIPRGSLEIRKIPMEGQVKKYVTAGEDITNYEVTRDIKAGSPVYRQHLIRPQCARRGDQIIVNAGRGSLKVRLVAKALASGRQGDRIMCMNDSTGRRFLVTLIDDREAALILSD